MTVLRNGAMDVFGRELAGTFRPSSLVRLRKRVSLGDRIDDWRVCWLGGWDKGRVFFVVMVVKEYAPGRVHAGIERR
jgi:hypothetical protein